MHTGMITQCAVKKKKQQKQQYVVKSKDWVTNNHEETHGLTTDLTKILTQKILRLQSYGHMIHQK